MLIFNPMVDKNEGPMGHNWTICNRFLLFAIFMTLTGFLPKGRMKFAKNEPLPTVEKIGVILICCWEVELCVYRKNSMSGSCSLGCIAGHEPMICLFMSTNFHSHYKCHVFTVERIFHCRSFFFNPLFLLLNPQFISLHKFFLYFTVQLCRAFSSHLTHKIKEF